MTIDWIKFLPALVLLFTPADWFNRGKVRYRDVERDWEGYWGRALAHGLHSIDLARAALGAWLIIDSLHVAPNARGFDKYEVLFLQGGIWIFAIFLQTVVCREKGVLLAPFAFVAGLLVTSVAPLVGLFAIAIALPVARGTRSAASFFPVAAIAYLAIGFWFKGKNSVSTLSFVAIATMLPFLLSLMFRHDLVSTHRAKRHVNDEFHSPIR